MNKLLIICDMFPPAFAPRMGYLCKYLTRMGWEVTVVTEYIEDNTFEFLTGYADVYCVRYYKASGKISKHIEWMWVMFLDILFGYKDMKIINACIPLIKTNQYKGILCSTYRTFPLTAAKTLAIHTNLPFVVDLRDIIEQYASNEYISHKFHTFSWLDAFITKRFRKRLLRKRNNALEVADCVTTVSPWHVEVLEQYNPNVKLIYNGFDPELFYPQQIKTSRFIITYTGRLLSLAIRNPELLFAAIARLTEDKVIIPETFRVVWYTDQESRSIIRQEAEQHGVQSFIFYLEQKPAYDIPLILNKSSVLLSLTNKFDTSGPKGFMTTKFFESLAVEKPILCVQSDEAYLAEAIKETHSGLAATRVDEVYDFLKHYYEEWQEKGYTTSPVNRDKLSNYSRKEQASQFARIFEEI